MLEMLKLMFELDLPLLQQFLDDNVLGLLLNKQIKSHNIVLPSTSQTYTPSPLLSTTGSG